jgi:hypothetical protein
MRIKIVDPLSWIISSNANIRREPIRPLKARINNFDELFDDKTIVYDAVHLPDRKQLLLLGPPLFNLQPIFEQMKVISLPDGMPCSFQIQNLENHTRTTIQVPINSKSINIQSTLGTFIIPLQEKYDELFTGRRVVFAISKDNHLDWIADWVRYHRDNHGADAVLIHDNSSQSYSAEELADKLSSISGIHAACVVRWPFKFGPQGFNGRYWDSFFCHGGAMEDARWRFLQNAKSVLNLDIDELMLSTGTSVFEKVEASESGYLSFNGLWAVQTRNEGVQQDVSPRPLLHRDLTVVLKPKLGFTSFRGLRIRPTIENRCPIKWAAVPSRHPVNVLWSLHHIKGINSAKLRHEKFEYRHFRPINTGWKYKRNIIEPFTERLHFVDPVLTCAFKKTDWDR